MTETTTSPPARPEPSQRAVQPVLIPTTRQRFSNSLKTVQEAFRQYWDQGLVILLVLMVLAEVGYLLWPKAHYNIVLTQLPASQMTDPVNPSEAATSQNGLPSDGLQLDSTASQMVTDTGNGFSSGRSAHPSHPQYKKKVMPKLGSVHLNSALASQLQQLPGVGEKMAQRILDYRKTSGPFKTLDDLMNVRGIGEKKFAKMKPYIQL